MLQPPAEPTTTSLRILQSRICSQDGMRASVQGVTQVACCRALVAIGTDSGAIAVWDVIKVRRCRV